MNVLPSMAICMILKNIPNYTKCWKMLSNILLLNPSHNTPLQYKTPIFTNIQDIHFVMTLLTPLFYLYHHYGDMTQTLQTLETLQGHLYEILVRENISRLGETP